MAGPFEQMMNPEAVMGQVQDPQQMQPQAQGGAPYASMMNPTAPVLQQMDRPASSPEEYEGRKAGWAEVIKHGMTNPHFQRALMTFGTHMMQPIQPGQSPLGATGAAIGMGSNAYAFSQEAEMAQQYRMAEERRKESKEQRETRESEASIESTKVLTQGRRTQNRVAEATEGDAIRKSRLDIQQAELNIKKATTAEEKEQILLTEAKRVAKVIADIPEPLLRQAEIDKITEPSLKKKVHEANIRQSNAEAGAAGARSKLAGAQTRLVTAQAEQEEQESKLGAAGRAELKKKLGNQSAQVMLFEFRKANYKVANPNATEQEVASHAERIMDTAKGKADEDRYLTWLSTQEKIESPEKMVARYHAEMGMIREGRAPGATPPPTGGSNPRAKTTVRQFDSSGKLIPLKKE